MAEHTIVSSGCADKRRLPLHCEAQGCDRVPHSRWKGSQALCRMHWGRMYKFGGLDLPARAWATCSIDECQSASRTRHGLLCEAHYYRQRRTGGFALAEISSEYSHSNGYKVRKAPAHPLARSNGWIFEHRIVAFEKYGEGPQACHWCGTALSWAEAVIDHLNEVKVDNRPENLVTSCSPCNRARGAMIPYLQRMLPERIAELVGTFGHMRAL